MLVAGMADGAGDLIIDLVCEEHRGGDRYQEMGDQPIGLQEKIVDAGPFPDDTRGRLDQGLGALDIAAGQTPAVHKLMPDQQELELLVVVPEDGAVDRYMRHIMQMPVLHKIPEFRFVLHGLKLLFPSQSNGKKFIWSNLLNDFTLISIFY